MHKSKKFMHFYGAISLSRAISRHTKFLYKIMYKAPRGKRFKNFLFFYS